MRKVGDRVIAILSATNGVVQSLGEGVYAGDHPLPEYALGLNFGQVNPRIDLDSGKTVWGCECWWGDPDAAAKQFAGDEWVWVSADIDEVRRERAL